MMNTLSKPRALRFMLVVMMFFGSFSLLNTASLEAAPRSQVQGESQVLVNVNHASLEDLQTVRGIGPSLAKRIIAFREENGPFEQADDLSDVRGIGGAKLQKIKNQITV